MILEAVLGVSVDSVSEKRIPDFYKPEQKRVLPASFWQNAGVALEAVEQG
jgi:hypothetical protein